MSGANKNPRCSRCDLLLLKLKGQRKLIENAEEATKYSNQLQRTIVVSDTLCQKCRVFQ